ncbi:transmembrane protein, putative [Medicago truncatula]|uniref:Transmembrane protein, putative n=1 Tax=Medicago truncatula TaxID=3880 RepID=A2Q5S3_MEDTR|nr:hypothetical protein MtrDRAFT_AC168204g14v2 [Medicago truncatula]AES77369.1 transmembrane protein, putative [Medicago truncatula]
MQNKNKGRQREYIDKCSAMVSPLKLGEEGGHSAHIVCTPFFMQKSYRTVGVAAGVVYYAVFGTVVTDTYGTTLKTAAKYILQTEAMCLCNSEE